MQLGPIGEKWSESDGEKTRLHKLKKEKKNTHNFHLNQSLKHTISQAKIPSGQWIEEECTEGDRIW